MRNLKIILVILTILTFSNIVMAQDLKAAANKIRHEEGKAFLAFETKMIKIKYFGIALGDKEMRRGNLKAAWAAYTIALDRRFETPAGCRATNIIKIRLARLEYISGNIDGANEYLYAAMSGTDAKYVPCKIAAEAVRIKVAWLHKHENDLSDKIKFDWLQFMDEYKMNCAKK